MITAISYDEALRKVVRERATQCALTLPELAKRSNSRTDYLSHCLNGIRPLTVATLKKLAPALDTTVQQLHNQAKALCD